MGFGFLLPSTKHWGHKDLSPQMAAGDKAAPEWGDAQHSQGLCPCMGTAGPCRAQQPVPTCLCPPSQGDQVS